MIGIIAGFRYKIESRIIWIVLVTNIRIAGTNLHDGFFVIGLAIVGAGSSASVVFAFYCFIPDVVSPIIVTSRETNDHIVPVFVVCCAKDVFIKNSDRALDCSGTLIGCARFQLRSDHHDVADSFTSICARYLIVCRPLRADILTIISTHHEVIVCSSSDRFRLNSGSRY